MSLTPNESLLEAVARLSAVPTILKLVTATTGLRLSLVAEVTESEWTCAAVNDQLGFGLEVHGKLPIETTICSEVRQQQRAIMFSHASADPTFASHPTPKLYKFESYISVPIFVGGKEYFGNLCALDADPKDLTPQTLQMFEVWAELIGLQLQHEMQRNSMNKALLDERQTAELREEFIAVLGHDLRTPLNAITTGLDVLAHTTADEGSRKTITRIERSASRMTGLVDDLLDFARGRLGGGIELARETITDVQELVGEVVDEVRLGHHGSIIIEGDPAPPIACDRARVAQALTNLLTNAVNHGLPGEPIRVTVRTSDAAVALAVTNAGPPIDPAKISLLFQPFKRGSTTSTGLGLGLYIVSEIARAHGGRVECMSTDEGTTFTLYLPRRL
jgi:signal transduction histidine kinase